MRIASHLSREKTGSEGLDKSEVAQLRDIILGKMETEAKNISIVEVK